MSDKIFKIYSSSAGSGKTYTLTKEYLKLVIVQPQLFKQILAVTFTNKATEEMKSRIIEKLADLGRGEQSPLTEELMQVSDLDAAALKERAGEVLQAILHDYSKFAVSTIDSFFQKVLRSFAYESLKKTNFAVELDQEKVVDEITNMVMADAGVNEALTHWLVQFAESKIEDQKHWDFREDIKQLSWEIFKEHFRDFEDSMSEKLKDKSFVPAFLEKIKKEKAIFENSMAAIADKALGIMQLYGVTEADFAYGKSGVGNYFNKLKNRDFEYGSRVTAAYSDPTKWLAKKAPQAAAEAVDNGLADLLREAVDYYTCNSTRYYSAVQVLRFIYTFGILSDITQKLQQYRDDNDVLLISDVPKMLNKIIADNDTPYIYEKVGTAYKHFLIDEFQDTSIFQWHNFKPLIENSLGSGNFNLVVGDVKQSIYRWRGGDWTLLLNKITQDISNELSERISLDDNWRSKKNVIDFNNSIFKNSPLLLLQTLTDKINDATVDEATKGKLTENASQLLHAYMDAYQHLPAGKAPEKLEGGFVNLEFYDKKEAEEGSEEDEALGWKDKVKSKLPALLTDLQDRGYQMRDIAVLVRTKREGSEIAQVMLEHKNSPEAKPGYNYDVISSESLYLSSATAIRLIISVLRYLRNPADRLAAVYMVQEYRRYVLETIYTLEEGNKLYRPADDNLTPEDDILGYLQHYMPAAFTEQLAYISKLPLYEMTEVLVSSLGLQAKKDEYAFLQSFQDTVLNYSRKEKTDINSFLHWWDTKGCSESVQVSEEQDAMRILTIHKSKGLQYKTVIIPFCNWGLDHSATQTNIIWSSADIEPFKMVNIIPLRYGSGLGKTFFAVDYFNEMIQSYMDSLNTLYVAFTRAEENLYVFAPKPVKPEKLEIRSVADLLYIAVSVSLSTESAAGKYYAPLHESWNDADATFTLGMPAKTTGRAIVSSYTQVQLETYPSVRWRDRLSIKPQATNFFSNAAEGKSRINYNQLLYIILSDLKSAADVEAELNKAYYQGQVTKEEREQLRIKVEELLTLPQLQGWFEPGWQIKSGTVMLSKNGNGSRPDKILVDGKAAKAISFVCEALNKTHQEKAYGHATILKQMGFEQVEAAVFSIEEKELVRTN
jgi:ATP-dependent helicase/nuclease subunit A